MRTTLLLTVFSVFFINAFSQNNTISKEKWHWGNELKQDTSAGYVQVVKVDNILYISGAVSTSLEPEGITRVYKALEASLKSFGATFHNVVKENLYTTDVETMKRNNASRKKFYNGDFPAATWVQIDRLFMESAKLEVEIIAHLPHE